MPMSRLALDPVLLRELRATVRPPAFGRVLTLGPAGVAAVVLLGALAVTAAGHSSATVGRTLFHTYFVAAFALVSVVSAVLGASGVSRDGESGMLEAIGLTHLSPVRYLAAKTAGPWAVVGALLAATMPAAAVPLLWGGVSPIELVTGTAVLVIAGLVGVATGVAVAARLSAARWSIVVSVAVVAPMAALGLAGLQIPAISAENAWQVPVDGPFWFASIPVAGVTTDAFVLALVVPLLAVAIALSYLATLALEGLHVGADRPRRGVEIWLAVALLLTAVGAALARPRLAIGASIPFAAGAVLVVAGLALVALVTNFGPTDGRRASPLPIVLVTAGGIVVATALPQLTAALWGPPPRCSCSAPHLAPVLMVAMHAWAFVVLCAGAGACARALLGPRRSARVATIAVILTLGGAAFLADAVRTWGLVDPSLPARLSPLYANWCTLRDCTDRLGPPAVVALAAGTVLLAAAAVVERCRSRRPA